MGCVFSKPDVDPVRVGRGATEDVPKGKKLAFLGPTKDFYNFVKDGKLEQLRALLDENPHLVDDFVGPRNDVSGAGVVPAHRGADLHLSIEHISMPRVPGGTCMLLTDAVKLPSVAWNGFMGAPSASNVLGPAHVQCHVLRHGARTVSCLLYACLPASMNVLRMVACGANH